MLADTEGPVCLPFCFLATMLPFFLALWPFVLMLISPAFSRSTFPTACSPSLLFSVVPDINAHGGEKNQNGKNAKEATETRPSLRRREESKRTKRERWIFFVQVVRRSDKKYVRLKMTWVWYLKTKLYMTVKVINLSRHKNRWSLFIFQRSLWSHIDTMEEIGSPHVNAGSGKVATSMSLFFTCVIGDFPRDL